MRETVVILDYGSQYTQLIARRVRELKVFSMIYPCTISSAEVLRYNPKGIILSGGPHSVYETGAPLLSKKILSSKVPLLGICYGLQSMVLRLKGEVAEALAREYGRTQLYIDDHETIFHSLPSKIVAWMSHGDKVVRLPPGFKGIAHTKNARFAAIADVNAKRYGVQFHPEVIHTQHGLRIISNFLFRICQCTPSWELKDFIKDKVGEIKSKVKKGRVICGLSGGVDSSTAAVLVHKALGPRLKCIFVDNGLLRKNEVRKVEKVFTRHFSLDLSVVDARKSFLKKLKGVSEPELKRKIIGHEFIRVFEEEARNIRNVNYLVQGTLYPDVIESVSFHGGPTSRIKSHHNVGGLPLNMGLKLIEPFRELFKDEVRKIAELLGLPDEIIHRQPFPGPGLAVRILGEVTASRLKILKNADAVLLDIMRAHNLYRRLWQSFCVLLPLKSVGVMGDKRTYEYSVVVRAVESVDGMTADWAKIPYPVLDEISNTLISKVRGINRVAYDISSKPPATIEWE